MSAIQVQNGKFAAVGMIDVPDATIQRCQPYKASDRFFDVSEKESKDIFFTQNIFRKASTLVTIGKEVDKKEVLIDK